MNANLSKRRLDCKATLETPSPSHFWFPQFCAHSHANVRPSSNIKRCCEKPSQSTVCVYTVWHLQLSAECIQYNTKICPKKFKRCPHWRRKVIRLKSRSCPLLLGFVPRWPRSRALGYPLPLILSMPRSCSRRHQGMSQKEAVQARLEGKCSAQFGRGDCVGT